MPLSEEFDQQLPKSFKFRRRPVSLAPDFRRDWKIASLLLLLHLCSRGGKSSLSRLHVLNWAIRTEKHRLAFVETRDSEGPLFQFRVRFEPAFSRAIEFAEAQKLVEWIDGDRLQITEAGIMCAKAVIKAKDLFQPELEFMSSLGKKLSEPQAMALISGAKIA